MLLSKPKGLLVTLKERLEEVLEELVGNKACIACKNALQSFEYNLVGMAWMPYKMRGVGYL